MNKPFDIELFLVGVLTGFHATRRRHLRQAMVIQTEIAGRWQRRRLGVGRESIWLGFSIITYAIALRRRTTTMC